MPTPDAAAYADGIGGARPGVTPCKKRRGRVGGEPKRRRRRGRGRLGRGGRTYGQVRTPLSLKCSSTARRHQPARIAARARVHTHAPRRERLATPHFPTPADHWRWCHTLSACRGIRRRQRRGETTTPSKPGGREGERESRARPRSEAQSRGADCSASGALRRLRRSAASASKAGAAAASDAMRSRTGAPSSGRSEAAPTSWT